MSIKGRRPTYRRGPGRKGPVPVKIGIDVGGTFTHAVAIHAHELEIVGTAVVPTTHTASEGVALGVVRSLRSLLSSCNIRPQDVHLVAHSTTQATNALLEGDVAHVGIIGMAGGPGTWRAKSQTRTGDIELAPGKYLRTYHRFVDTSSGIRDQDILAAAEALRAEGAEVFVLSEAFSVDDATNEQTAAEILRSHGLLVTAASDITKLYGLKVRTRTAVINASMLPKMLETADMTERSVKEAGIRTPLMIMRSDGGIMDVAEMRRRPILTMLSGPAAGVAAALMYVHISDGIFLEVGGTSTDISVIRNGRPMVRTAQVGGHRLFLKTLDIRTVGIGGGSMVRYKDGRLLDVGPRSAHIAGLRYPSFSDADELKQMKALPVQPRPGDPSDYLAMKRSADDPDGMTVTTTDAANILGIPTGYAAARKGSADALKEWISSVLGRDPRAFAREVLRHAAEKVLRVVDQFAAEYRLERELLVLVGGGGGAVAVVPTAGELSGLQATIAGNAEIISAIGVALGMIRDTIERSVIEPTEQDILKIRAEALASVIRMGASAESAEVRVEVDTRHKRLIATAMGVPELRKRDLTESFLNEQEIRRIAESSFGLATEEIHEAGSSAFLHVYAGTRKREYFFGLFTNVRNPVRVIGKDGIIRLKLMNGVVKGGKLAVIGSLISSVLEEHTIYGDAGGLLPDAWIVIANRIIDLSGVATREQMISLFRVETETHPGDEPAALVIAPKT